MHHINIVVVIVTIVVFVIVIVIVLNIINVNESTLVDACIISILLLR